MSEVETDLKRECPACGSIGEDPGEHWKEGRLRCPADCRVRIFLKDAEGGSR